MAAVAVNGHAYDLLPALVPPTRLTSLPSSRSQAGHLVPATRPAQGLEVLRRFLGGAM